MMPPQTTLLYVNIGSGNGTLPSGNKLLFEAILTLINGPMMEYFNFEIHAWLRVRIEHI